MIREDVSEKVSPKKDLKETKEYASYLGWTGLEPNKETVQRPQRETLPVRFKEQPEATVAEMEWVMGAETGDGVREVVLDKIKYKFIKL